MKINPSQVFSTRTQSIPVGRPLVFDVFIKITGEIILFKKAGDVVSQMRLDDLLKHSVKEIYIPKNQRDIYLKSLKDIVKDPDSSNEVKGRFIKETAFNHIEDLFNNKDVSVIAKESTGLVEDMVEFISTDLSAATSLMKLSSHDYYTYNHSVNVSVYSIAICKTVLGEDKNLLVTAGLGGLLHDLGKRKVDTKLINKPGKLDAEEWVEMKRHPGYGYELLQDVPSISDDIKRIVHEHHEHMDGTGYPQGLTDTQILKLSKIASVADVFDALTTKRSYKEACTAKEALEIMANMQEGKFDPDVFKNLQARQGKKTEITLDKNVDPCLPNINIKKAS
jgi:putative nucleotidyltransferase with HDIG domain